MNRSECGMSVGACKPSNRFRYSSPERWLFEGRISGLTYQRLCEERASGRPLVNTNDPFHDDQAQQISTRIEQEILELRSADPRSLRKKGPLTLLTMKRRADRDFEIRHPERGA